MHSSGGKKEPVCVGILGSDPLRSVGLQTILEDSLKLQTVLLSGDGKPSPPRPTVVIVDGDLQGAGNDAPPLRQVRKHLPGVAIVVLARLDTLPGAEQLLGADVRAVLPETAEVEEIRACIRAVVRGKTWLPSGVDGKQPSVPAPVDEPPTLAERFTPREREVLSWLAQGHSNREIAATMGIDEATVKAHLGRMLRKGNASNRVELTLRALAGGKGGPDAS